jgi:hypothetical protein
MASSLKRVSPATEAAVLAIAQREDRTFVAQLDRVVDAGLRSMGEPGILPDAEPEQAKPARARRATAAKR